MLAVAATSATGSRCRLCRLCSRTLRTPLLHFLLFEFRCPLRQFCRLLSLPRLLFGGFQCTFTGLFLGPFLLGLVVFVFVDQVFMSHHASATRINHLSFR